MQDARQRLRAEQAQQKPHFRRWKISYAISHFHWKSKKRVLKIIYWTCLIVWQWTHKWGRNWRPQRRGFWDGWCEYCGQPEWLTIVWKWTMKVEHITYVKDTQIVLWPHNEKSIMMTGKISGRKVRSRLTEIMLDNLRLWRNHYKTNWEHLVLRSEKSLGCLCHLAYYMMMMLMTKCEINFKI